MEAKRLTEWLGTTDGLIKVATGVIGSIGAILAAVTGQLKPVFDRIGHPEVTQPLVFVAVVSVLVWYFWRDYRRYAR
ncbi:MAG: hypothetical protein JOY66_04055, partial [Acetobacteraceae bacterium]|nr:hypothetical protein [Acetobacteraceae bacterium]